MTALLIPDGQDGRPSAGISPRLAIGRLAPGTDPPDGGQLGRGCYQVVLRSPDDGQYLIQVRTEHLEAHAAKLLGRPSEPLDLGPTFDPTSSAAQALLATTVFVHAELIRPGGLSTMPVACHELESALMTQLLMVVPSQLTPLLSAAPRRMRRAGLRAVLDLIEADPTAVLSTADLAARAGLSPRALQVFFQDAVGVTPTAYLRAVRLDRVHYDLLAGTSGSVAEVAVRWGFYHPSRFARQYRERFGNLPSETARSQRSAVPAGAGPAR